MAYLQLWINKTVRPIWEALTILIDKGFVWYGSYESYHIGVPWASPLGRIYHKNILSKPFINMNRLFQPIIALAWNEDMMILLKKCFTLKLNLISRMVFGSQVPYATCSHYSTVFQRYFHFVRRYRNHCGTEMIGKMGTQIPLNNHFRF